MKIAPSIAIAVSLCFPHGEGLSSELASEAWRALVPEKLAGRPEFAFVPNDSKLPNVLLYGDSISMGYTTRVREQLRERANVYRLHSNGNHSGRFVELMSEMQRAMQDEKLDSPWTFQWDVIHFNVGLHDLKYVLNGKKNKQNGKQVSSLDDYKNNLQRIIAYLRELAPNARLVFATTTPVPEGSSGRFSGDAMVYNQAATEVLSGHPDIFLNDLYSLVLPNQAEWWIRPGNVHFNQVGSRALGDQVARSIARVLPRPQAASRFVQKLQDGESQTIVVYGTSLTNTGQWRRQFAAVLAARYGERVSVINAAKSGSDSIWGLKNLEKQVLRHEPDVLFMEFSMNDAIAKRGISIEDARESLESMIDLTTARYPDCEIILMSMNPSLRSGKSLQRPRLAAYYESWREVAAERSLQFIDNHDAWNRFLNKTPGNGTRFIPDSIHPNGLGTKSVITPHILRAVGIEVTADEIPEYEDPPAKKRRP